MGRFIGAHSFLPEGFERMPVDKVFELGKLLMDGGVPNPTKEVVLMLLAHHPTEAALNILRAYNRCPDKNLRLFARLALDECQMWNEE
jgi:hypothetical protein